MFIYSVRASTIRFFLVIVLTLSLLVGILLFGGIDTTVSASNDVISFDGIKTNEDRIAFIRQFGIEVSNTEVDRSEFSVPSNFDKIISGYNEIQRRQGLDLTKYKNKKVTRYTYSASNYEGRDTTVYVNLIIYKNKVIACDVSSPAPDGFVKPLVTEQS